MRNATTLISADQASELAAGKCVRLAAIAGQGALRPCGADLSVDFTRARSVSCHLSVCRPADAR